MVEATPPKATKTRMNAGWGINPAGKQSKSSKTMQRKQKRLEAQKNEMNFDDLDSEFTNYAPPSQYAPDALSRMQNNLQSSDAIRLNNRQAIQQQRFVKKSQVDTGRSQNAQPISARRVPKRSAPQTSKKTT